MQILFSVDATHRVVRECEVVKLEDETIYVNSVPYYLKDYAEIVIFTSGGGIPIKMPIPNQQRVESVGPRLIVPKIN